MDDITALILNEAEESIEQPGGRDLAFQDKGPRGYVEGHR